MTAAGTTTSEKHLEPNSALSEILFHDREAFVAVCSAQTQFAVDTTSAPWKSQPGERLHHQPLRAIIRFFFFQSYAALTLAPIF